MPLSGWINRSGYLRKWLVLGIAIGVIAGLGAVAFYLALDYASKFLLGYLAGYDIPKPVGDGGDAGSAGFDRPWAIPLVTFGSELVDAPGLPDSPGVFVVVGMMACFGSVAHAPLAVMIMVSEMTGSFSVVPGAMVAIGIAYLLISRTDVTIYRAQRLDREAAEAER